MSCLEELSGVFAENLSASLKQNDLPFDVAFSVRQLQEKYREQQKPLYFAFIDLTKAFNLVSRKVFFKILFKDHLKEKAIEGIYIHTRSNRNFTLSRLRVKTKVQIRHLRLLVC